MFRKNRQVKSQAVKGDPYDNRGAVDEIKGSIGKAEICRYF